MNVLNIIFPIMFTLFGAYAVYGMTPTYFWVVMISGITITILYQLRPEEKETTSKNALQSFSTVSKN